MPDAASPLPFALLRIAVFGSMALIDILADAGTRTALLLPRSLTAPVPGAPWLRSLLRLPIIVRLSLLWLFRISAAAAAVGLCTSISTGLAVSLSIVFLGVPSLYGGVRALHHLWWFGAVLAVTPCGEIVSLDALAANDLPGDFPWSVAHQLVLAVFGMIYFFPGVWKLRRGGWAWGDTLPATVQSLWFNTGGIPRWISAMLEMPGVCRIAGLVVIAFELSFPVLVVTFPIGTAVAGLSFHALNAAVVRIPFWHLAVCYVFLLAPAVSAGHRTDHLQMLYATNAGLALLAVGVTVMVGVAAAGVTGRRWWPFGVYPTFADPPSLTIASLRYDSYHGGHWHGVDLAEIISDRTSGRRSLTLLSALAAQPRLQPDAAFALHDLVSSDTSHRLLNCSTTWRIVREERPRRSPATLVREDILFTHAK